ncbi:hypothetical protein GH714_030539 [Hevea brasiliensis]|uniref:Uncharacterized protein n=1 Tax=Hevea brasiliensis TaxID=3981 RepID=A0A6A6LCB6_HEVBR|nr:hypothetical protein GH714_030539 [Hevea brasiliensis]
MVCSMGKNAIQVKKVIALWLVLEEIGYHDLIRAINSFDNTTIEALYLEALQCLECIQPNSIQPTGLSDQAQVFLGLIDEPMNRRFLYCKHDFIYKRYEHVMETVCDKIFGETNAVEVDESGFRPVAKTYGQGLAGSSSSEPNEATSQSNLNPDAIDFNPAETPEEFRTIFLTFSMGYPLSRDEIIRFFTKKWGEVVKDVYIERTEAGQDPQYEGWY